MTDFTPARMTFLAVIRHMQSARLETRSLLEDSPISTPRPFKPTISTLEAAIRFIAVITHKSWDIATI